MKHNKYGLQVLSAEYKTHQKNESDLVHLQVLFTLGIMRHFQGMAHGTGIYIYFLKALVF